MTFDFCTRSDFIPESVVGAPLDFVWKGALNHIGPEQTVTPLWKQLSGVTMCAQVSLCAGILLWERWRLEGLAEVEHDQELAEASFAYCIDWRYTDQTAGPRGRPPDQPPATSAAMQVNLFMRRSLFHQDYWDSPDPPVQETFHSAHLVRHTMPNAGKKTFDDWLTAVASRLQSYHPKPKDRLPSFYTFESEALYDQAVAPYRGVPVPPQLLDPSFDYNPDDREALVAEFLAGLDPSRNRYLRTPEQMLELGFEGVPYQIN